jgi:hypothetical protein
MDKVTNEQLQLAEELENIRFPEVRTPFHKERLKSVLLDHAHPSRQPARLPVFRSLSDMFFGMRRKMAFALPVVALLLLLVTWQAFTPAPQAFAYLVLEVNPAVRLTIDTNNKVIGFEAMDPRAREVFQQLKLRSKKAEQAVVEIVDRFYDQGILTPGGRVLLVMSPVAVVKQENLTAALDPLHSAVSRRLLELNIEIAANRFVMDAQTFGAAEQAGLMPSRYVRLLEAGISPEILTLLFKTGAELEIEKNAFAGQFAAIADLFPDLLDAGIPEKEAINLIKELVAAGVGSVGLEAALTRLLDIVDDGANLDSAIAGIRSMLKTGQGFEKTDRQGEEEKTNYKEPADDDEVKPEDEEGSVSTDTGKPASEEAKPEDKEEQSGINGNQERPGEEVKEKYKPDGDAPLSDDVTGDKAQDPGDGEQTGQEKASQDEAKQDEADQDEADQDEADQEKANKN